MRLGTRGAKGQVVDIQRHFVQTELTDVVCLLQYFDIPPQATYLLTHEGFDICVGSVTRYF